RNSFTKKKRQRLWSSTRRLRSPGGSVLKNRHNSSTAFWTVSRKNWNNRGSASPGQYRSDPDGGPDAEQRAWGDRPEVRRLRSSVPKRSGRWARRGTEGVGVPAGGKEAAKQRTEAIRTVGPTLREGGVMRSRMILAAVILTMLAGLVVLAQTSAKQHFNPMVDLLQQHKPVFGIYLPSAFNLPGAAPRGQGNRGGEGGRGRGQYKVADGYPPQESPCDEAAELVKNPPKVSPASPEDVKQQNEIAKLAMGHHEQDYLFSGSFEGGVEKPLPVFTELMKGLSANGMVAKSPAPRMMPVML